MPSMVLRKVWLVAALCLLASPVRAADVADKEAVTRGTYLAQAADCTSCHTAPGGKPFAGGLPIQAPFGTIYSTNITPDPVAGIGRYSEADFSRALRRGITKEGHHLYPAMPYPSFAELSDQDTADLYAYFMHEVSPVADPSPVTKLPFPFNQRWGLAIWNFLFSHHQKFQPEPAHDESWNRGAYLATALEHCGACHTPRSVFYNEEAYRETGRNFLTGETLDHWYAPDLRGNSVDGLGQWPEGDIATFLKTGVARNVTAFGSMTQVVENSTQHLTDKDLQALAHYLKSLAGDKTRPGIAYRPSAVAATGERPGAGIYAQMCAACHGAHGAGRPPRFPALAGNSAVLAPQAISLTRIVLEGGQTARIAGGARPAVMPAFGEKLSDSDIADVVSYIRNDWGNEAPPVSARDVAVLRKTLKNEQ